MKKVALFIAIIISLGVSAQRYEEWSFTVPIDTLSRQDTVIQAPYSLTDFSPDVRDVAAYKMSFTISSSGLDTSIFVTPGSSNNEIGSTGRYAFESLPGDSLPYRFYEPSHMVITNYDTTYQQTLHYDQEFPHKRPQFKLDKDSATTGNVTIDVLFYLSK